jgi:uncharacterized phage-like protein YoqJ
MYTSMMQTVMKIKMALQPQIPNFIQQFLRWNMCNGQTGKQDTISPMPIQFMHVAQRTQNKENKNHY